MSFLLTRSGIPFDLERPQPSMVLIDDIAVALSRQPRFNGHTRDFYSVAEHCCLVSKIVAQTHPELALVGLLHDAAEAYVGDLISPIKRGLPAFRKLEEGVSGVIGAAFGVELEDLPLVVKQADLQALVSEATCYLGVEDFSDWEPADLPEPEWALGRPLAPSDAQLRFLQRFEELQRLRRAA